MLEHVTSYVMESVLDLEQFIQDSEDGLNWRSMEGEKDNGRTALLTMMGHLAAVRSRQPTTDAMFGPMNQVITSQQHDNNSNKHLCSDEYQ